MADGLVVIAVAFASCGFYSALPTLFGAVAHPGHFSDQQIGWLGFIELARMLAVSLLHKTF